MLPSAHALVQVEAGPVADDREQVTDLPVSELEFGDDKMSKDTKRYWVVAVDALGQEGFPSAPVWRNRQYRKYYEPFVGEWHQ